MSGARPGWYPDPGGAPGYRWWDGTEWTDAVGDSRHAPEPVGALPVRTQPAENQPTQNQPAQNKQGVGTPSVPGQITTGQPTTGQPTTGGRARLHQATAWTIGVAVLAVAGVVLGLVIWHEPTSAVDRAKAGAAPRPAATGAEGELDQDSRLARIGGASMTLPDDPYRVRPDPMRAKGLFDSYFVGVAIVHENYHDRHDWAALVGLAHVASGVASSDPETTARAVTDGIAAQFFDRQPVTIGAVSLADHSVDGCSGVLVSAEVRYRIAGLASRADRLTVVVVRLDDGTEVAAFSSVPTDADQALRDLAATSLDSLHVD
ncbi:DUF2510 domain-containing protein [Microlunatus ginsengisoli]|uniref:DUF2510 domain-containing protein n=1 Tax=Microlunatus ginsengisoli TaxID=363863 RepID=A0ABP6ZSR7_9ACTN